MFQGTNCIIPGLDSLHAVQIRAEIKPLFTKFVVGEDLAHNITYTYPTISRLSAYLIARSKGENFGLDDPIARASRLEACTERWGAKLPKRTTKPLTTEPKKTFALTGSTGSLGVHTLRYLLERDDVGRVYCLHRGSSDIAVQKHRKLFQDRALPVELLDSEKLAFAQVDLSKPDLALPAEKYKEVNTSFDVSRNHELMMRQVMWQSHSHNPRCLGTELQLGRRTFRKGPHCRRSSPH